MKLESLAAPLLALGLGAQLARMSVPGRYRVLYEDAARRHPTVDADLLHAFALHESHENAAAIGAPNTNGSQDFGLMQINNRNFQGLGLTQATAMIPEHSVDAAARLLAGNLAAAPNMNALDQIAVYNAGFSDQDADPLTPGKQRRPKLDASGAYSNANYVREVASWYALVKLAKLAPIKTTGWSAR